MEKFGDYIPLIIIAVSLVFSFVKGAKKNAKKRAEQTVPLFPEIPQREMSNPQVKPRTQSQPRRKIQLLETTIPKREEVFNPDVERTVPSIQIEEISDESGLDINFADSEELKKGIIFAEIFNRKY